MLRRTRRAPAACSWCHRRKVRCDASISGCPCTRCKQDGRTICTLRAKLPKSGFITNTTSPPVNHHSECTGSSIDDPDVDEPSRILFHTSPSTLKTNEPRAIGIENFHSDDYPFLENETSFLSSQDVAFLTLKGSLALPNRALALRFVELYFQYIHPFVPVIDEHKFWRIWDRQCDEKLSLFLFQAMLFASCPFVPIDLLNQAGYENKREARKHLYQKAKLLFDLNADINTSAKAQGALLLTHHTSADAPQAGSLWLTRAIEHAMVVDSHPSDSFMGVSESMRKRLWWCILLRDRSICIGLRRRPQINSIRIDGCFDQLNESDFTDEMRSSRVHNYETKKKLFIAFQEQCNLALLLTELVCLIFTPGLAARRHLAPDEFCRHNERVENIRQSLLVWESHAQPAPSVMSQPGIYDPVSTLKSLTFMYYYAARVDLAQHAALLTEEHSNAPPFGKSYHLSIKQIACDLEAGMAGLTATMEYFSLNGNVEHLPLSVLAYAAMPLVLAAINLKISPSYLDFQKSQRTLDSISNIIRHSESLYDVTDVVAAGTSQILQLAYLVTKNMITASHSPSKPHKLHYRTALEGQSQQQSSYSCQAKNWVEAFIRIPRAYLLISTCVDYSLAFGHLPCGDSLPLSVRPLVSGNGIGRLPWTIRLRRDECYSSCQSDTTKDTDDVISVNDKLSNVTMPPGPFQKLLCEHEYIRPLRSPGMSSANSDINNARERSEVNACYSKHVLSTLDDHELVGKPKHKMNLDFLDFDSN